MDRFASNANKQLPRYNAKWRDGTAEAVVNLHLPDSAWRAEHNWCNPPWELLDDLAAKLRSSGAAASVIAPYWPKKPWFVHLAAMASKTIDMPPSRDLFSPQRRLGQGGSDLPPGASWPSESHSAVDVADQPVASRRYTPTSRTHPSRSRYGWKNRSP